jgi:hypothetical protein
MTDVSTVRTGIWALFDGEAKAQVGRNLHSYPRFYTGRFFERLTDDDDPDRTVVVASHDRARDGERR